ncbi:hypothetical protein [Pseudanabaena sp. FACHB-2040]|uniref:hypothetical protein n=1 Tax=Pseudanabaena sp. FACHB-2040 TaxID=2692859 RepID=UPI001685B7C9|nr:hypothetical protein [Pseudanabaena sp. FACHB-2040]MBD2258054.1 hypothetical protein [Pseudanabaena sp. FACHB-2040]
MIQPVKTVPDILRDTQSAADSARKPIRIFVCGLPKGVESIVQRLHIEGFAQVGEWSKPLPSPIEGEIMRILTRYCEG